MRLQHRFNPFTLMVHPETVLQAMENSERLQTLQRRICRPLDTPGAAQETEIAEFVDDSLDATLAEHPDLFRL